MGYKLTIGICTLPARINSYYSLISNLNNQIITNGFQNSVQLLSFMDCKNMSVGEKRNLIKKQARGDYFNFIDDDDRISGDYLPSLMDATKHGADAITFRGEYKEHSKITDFTITTMGDFVDTHFMQYRRPNHISPVCRDIYEKCDFTLKNYGEDSDYSERINKLIKTEYHILKKLYFYDFELNTSQTHPKHKMGAYH